MFRCRQQKILRMAEAVPRCGKIRCAPHPSLRKAICQDLTRQSRPRRRGDIRRLRRQSVDMRPATTNASRRAGRSLGPRARLGLRIRQPETATKRNIMPLHINAFPDHALTHAELEAWRAIPTSIASDELNRTSTPDAGLKKISSNTPLVGLAFTVRTMAGDNLALHHAVSWSMAASATSLRSDHLPSPAMRGVTYRRVLIRAGEARSTSPSRSAERRSRRAAL